MSNTNKKTSAQMKNELAEVLGVDTRECTWSEMLKLVARMNDGQRGK